MESKNFRKKAKKIVKQGKRNEGGKSYKNGRKRQKKMKENKI